MFGYRIDFVIDDEIVDTYTREHQGKEKFLLSRTMKGFINGGSRAEIRITPFSKDNTEFQSREEEGNMVKVKGELIIEQIRHFR